MVKVRVGWVGIRAIASLGVLIATSCSWNGRVPSEPLAKLVTAAEELEVPASQNSGMYTLASTEGDNVYLSWVEPDDTGHALKFSRLTSGTWSPAQLIARGDNWFVNWGDKPSIAALPDGRLMAHWLVYTPNKSGVYGYGLKIAYSPDNGQTWTGVYEAGMDNVSEYSGFVSFAANEKGFLASYLTPLLPGSEQTEALDRVHVQTLRNAQFGPTGELLHDESLDLDVCSCCPLGMANTSAGPVVVYRDHLPGEIRDISIVRLVSGKWTEPMAVHRDGWKINGCPSNGPAIAARDQRVAVAWFTGVQDPPQVRMAFSKDGGASFGPPVVINEGKPTGWPAVVLLDDGRAVVSWLELSGDVRLRGIQPNGTLEESAVISAAASGRDAGMPQMVRTRDQLVLAWRSNKTVRSAVIPLQL
jgi:hypothetical protein